MCLRNVYVAHTGAYVVGYRAKRDIKRDCNVVSATATEGAVSPFAPISAAIFIPHIISNELSCRVYVPFRKALS